MTADVSRIGTATLVRGRANHQGRWSVISTGAAANPIHYEYTIMATARRSLKINAIRSHLKAIDALFAESDEKLAAASDGVLSLAGAEPEQHGAANDAKPRGSKSMSEAFPGFDRIRKNY